ncbi:DUF2249 domain-containing protein [Hydrogenimonas sp. SS33]|uniref:DUF2249 domain-containing protein n=1 Tax=Hydrogenimonas leucolamina TaxID=2954236 RepID=UPI00336BCF2B
MIELDARGLNHPEPLERSMDVFKWMDGEDIFHLTIHRLPQPLLMIAERFGIRYEVCEAGEGEWHVYFTKSPTVDLASLCKACHV